MILTKDMYVPALRWRQGEYQALAGLAAAAKDRIVPYVTIPEVEFDFELLAAKEDGSGARPSVCRPLQMPSGAAARMGRRTSKYFRQAHGRRPRHLHIRVRSAAGIPGECDAGRSPRGILTHGRIRCSGSLRPMALEWPSQSGWRT